MDKEMTKMTVKIHCKARELTNKLKELEKGDDMNQTLEHTPGPWTHTLNESGSMRGVWGKPKGSNITGMVCYMTNPVSANQEGAANAHLIGASPELLAAAIDMLEWFGEVNRDTFDLVSIPVNEQEWVDKTCQLLTTLDWVGLHKVLDRATAAIAKAKGGSK